MAAPVPHKPAACGEAAREGEAYLPAAREGEKPPDPKEEETREVMRKPAAACKTKSKKSGPKKRPAAAIEEAEAEEGEELKDPAPLMKKPASANGGIVAWQGETGGAPQRARKAGPVAAATPLSEDDCKVPWFDTYTDVQQITFALDWSRSNCPRCRKSRRRMEMSFTRRRTGRAESWRSRWKISRGEVTGRSSQRLVFWHFSGGLFWATLTRRMLSRFCCVHFRGSHDHFFCVYRCAVALVARSRSPEMSQRRRAASSSRH